MSFGAVETAPQKKKLLNIGDQDYSANQQAVLGAYFAGVAKLSLTWISPLYNLTSVPVKDGSSSSKGSSKGGSSAPPQLNWYADIAGFACVCPDDAPVDTVLYVLVNEDIGFTGPLARASGADYAGFSVDTYCQEARVYWGTKTQPIDDLILTPRGPFPDSRFPGIFVRDQTTWPTNQQLDGAPSEAGDPNPVSGHYDFHSGYRNQCYFCFKQFFLGSSQNMPSVVVILARGAKLIGGGGTYPAAAGGVPPLNSVYEIMTDDMIGPGKTDADLVIASWQNTNIKAIDAGVLLAPVVTDSQSYRDFLADYVQYYFGWFRRNGNQIEAGAFPLGYIDPDTLPAIDSDALTAEPKVKPTAQRQLSNHFNIVYTNAAAWYNEDGTLRYINNALITSTGQRVYEVIQRPFIILSTLAQLHVTQYGTYQSKDASSGSFPMKREIAKSLGFRQGDLVNLESAADGEAFVVLVMQMDRGDYKDGTFQITWNNYRADWPVLYSQPPAPKDPDFEVYASEITNALVTEIPSGLETTSGISIAVLAERPQHAILGFYLWMSLDNTSYIKLLGVRYFAVRGTVAVLYPGTTAKIDGSVGMQVDLFGPDLLSIVSQTAAQRDDNNLIGLCETEWFSAWTIVPVTGHAGRVKMFQKRALYGTVQSDHEIGQTVWLIFRSHLTPVENGNFLPGLTRWFKAQPYTAGPVIDLPDCDPIAHTFFGGAVSPISNLVLTPGYSTTPDGRKNSYLTATWSFPDDQDIANFNVSILRTGDTDWTTRAVGGSALAIWNFLQSNTLYKVRVQAVNADGQPSAWSNIVTVTTADGLTLSAPFTRNGYDGTILLSRGFTDLDQVSVQGQASASGRRIRFVTDGDLTAALPDPSASDYWGWDPAQHGGVNPGYPTIPGREGGQLGPTDFVGYVISDGVIGDAYAKTVTFAIAVVDANNPTILGPVARRTFTYIPGAGQQLSAPFFNYVAFGSGVNLGDADYRVQLFDTQPDGGCTIYFSFNDGPFIVYSKTGNYKGPGTGAVLPTGNVGVISLGQSDVLHAYSVKTDFLQSKTVDLYNNVTNTPDSGGGGGSGGTGGGTDASRRFPP